jgi:hypothetical protein
MNSITILIVLLVSVLLIIVGVGIIALKTYQDREKVNVFVTYGDRRMKKFKVKPHDNTVSVDGMTFNINDKDFTLVKNIPTYVFSTKNTEPIDLFTGKNSQYSPSQYRTAIDNNIVDEIFKSTNKKGAMDGNNLIMLLLFGIIGALGIIAYFGYDNISYMIEQIQKIVEALETVGLEV